MRELAPYLLLLAILLVLLYSQLARYKKRRSAEYVSSKNLPGTVYRRSWLAYYARVVCIVTSWILIVMALMRPAETPESAASRAMNTLSTGEAAQINIDEIVIVLDVSSSMAVKDSSNGSSRLARSKEIIKSLLDNLGGIQVSLILFGENAINEVPDTLDYLFFRILLDSVGINENVTPGTNLLAMSDQIRKKVVGSPFSKKSLVLLFSDGEDTGFLGLPPAELNSAQAALYNKMNLPNTRWDIIGMGSKEGGIVPGVTFEGKAVTSHLYASRLEEMAHSGQGHYYGELELPFTQIVDNILADIAASGQGQVLLGQMATREAEASSLNEPLTGDIRFHLIAALLLLFAALALPQHERTPGTIDKKIPSW